jgi:hypothetical protein
MNFCLKIGQGFEVSSEGGIDLLVRIGSLQGFVHIERVPAEQITSAHLSQPRVNLQRTSIETAAFRERGIEGVLFHRWHLTATVIRYLPTVQASAAS